jgi:hypothetical protein
LFSFGLLENLNSVMAPGAFLGCASSATYCDCNLHLCLACFGGIARFRCEPMGFHWVCGDNQKYSGLFLCIFACFCECYRSTLGLNPIPQVHILAWHAVKQVNSMGRPRLPVVRTMREKHVSANGRCARKWRAR